MAKTKLPKIPAVTFEEISFAYQVGGLAASGTTPQSGVAGMGVNIDMGGGEIERVELKDIPLNRAAIAIRDQFPKGMLLPLLTRITAMGEMLEHPEAQRYMRDAPDGSGEVELSGAVLTVAARMPVNAKMSFARKQFFVQVAAEYDKDPDIPKAASNAPAPGTAD